jgi:hypothetical protein
MHGEKERTNEREEKCAQSFFLENIPKRPLGKRLAWIGKH